MSCASFTPITIKNNIERNELDVANFEAKITEFRRQLYAAIDVVDEQQKQFNNEKKKWIQKGEMTDIVNAFERHLSVIQN